MTFSLRLVAGVLLVLSPAPVAASSCAKEIAALNHRIKDMATLAISISTASKEVAAAREAKAIEAREMGRREPSPPSAPAVEGPEVEALKQAEAAGAGGDRVMQAEALLHRAQALEQEGNSVGCMEAVAEAKRRLDQ
jgi:hypothetical protein